MGFTSACTVLQGPTKVSLQEQHHGLLVPRIDLSQHGFPGGQDMSLARVACSASWAPSNLIHQ